ncbi:MAG TPA: S-methyl-5'-thioadenosine phosphorylase [Thermoanaerobaculia bacterium]
MSDIQIGIIGGSGLYAMDGVAVQYERTIDTPFGAPSDPYVIGEVDGIGVAFLSRHGKGHRYTPSEVNYRANIYGFKELGVHTILSASAVGSMKEEYKPTDLVFPHQFIDRTRHRADTFFGNGLVAHVPFADPICARVSFLMGEAAREAGATTHMGGVYLCMEGPQFSTRAESNLYRTWGVDVIGMTNLTEAKLAREAEICYATMALVTDYDCWHPDHDDVDIEQILGYLRANASMAQTVLKTSITRAAGRTRDCGCANALQFAIISDRGAIPDQVKQDLAPLIRKYIQ